MRNLWRKSLVGGCAGIAAAGLAMIGAPGAQAEHHSIESRSASRSGQGREWKSTQSSDAVGVSVTSQAKRVRSDFNGDGFADLAITGSRSTARVDNLGVVLVIYGSARGLRAAHNQLLTPSEIGGGRQEFTLFGSFSSVASGDFNGDRYSDLAVGRHIVRESDNAVVGQVGVIYGSARGLVEKRSQRWTQKVLASPGHRTGQDDTFGVALAAGNFGKGAADDLAIGDLGARDADEGDIAYVGPGTVTVLYGSSAGLRSAGRQVWSQASRGVPGKSGVFKQFGFSLAAADFGRSRHSDLAIGVPDSDNGLRNTFPGPGAINVLYGSASGLTVRGSQLWSQRSRDVKGAARNREYFGYSLAAGHFDGRRAADLAIGVVGDRKNRGAVNVLYGSSKGLTATGNQLWTRRRTGLAGRSQLTQFLGASLAAGKFRHNHGGGAYDGLAITSNSHDGRSVEVVYGSEHGLTARGSQNWRWGTPGVKGSGRGYGSSVAAANFGRGRYADLATSDADHPTRAGWGAVSVLYGSHFGLTANRDQFWTAPKLNRPRIEVIGEALGQDNCVDYCGP